MPVMDDVIERHPLQAEETVVPSLFTHPSLTLFPEMSGTGEDISQVHWKQQWLENGTLYFHVSMTESELLAQTTQSTSREPAHVLPEHMHLLHISVMVSLDTLTFRNSRTWLLLISGCQVNLDEM